MTTPGSGDGLVRPQNAPSGQQVVSGIQPGTTGGVTLAQYVVVFGTPNPATGAAPGVFVYSGTPAAGNSPVLSLTLATEDPYGNAIAPGIAAGHFGAVQALLSVVAGFGQVLVPTGSSLEFAAGGLAGLLAGGAPVAQLFSPQQVASGALSSRMIVNLQSPGASANPSATFGLVYNDDSGGSGFLVSADYTGTNLFTVAFLAATQPGTGTSATNRAQAESWHTAALVNGWAASNGVGGLFYQKVPIPSGGGVWIEADITNATATGNSVCAVLPAGYRPSTAVNKQAAWNNPVASNSASVPWVSIDTAGNVQITGIEQANHEIFFGFLMPLGAL